MPVIDTATLRQGEVHAENEAIYNGRRAVQLTRGFITWVDEEDFCLVSQFSWFAQVTKLTNKLYVRAASKQVGNGQVYMHHLVLRIDTRVLYRRGQSVDHEDGNALHNWKSNLKVASRYSNMLNTERHRNRVGVCYNKRANLWIAYLDEPYRNRKYLGYRKTKEEALALVEEARKCL